MGIACDVTCPAYGKNKADYATEKRCNGAGACEMGDCCEYDPKKCSGHAPATGKGCGTDEVMDASKMANAVKDDSSDYKSQCCSAKVTCEAFKDRVNSQSTSASVKQQTLAMALLLTVGGVLVYGK